MPPIFDFRCFSMPHVDDITLTLITPYYAIIAMLIADTPLFFAIIFR
jgi:hypothetical protein